MLRVIPGVMRFMSCVSSEGVYEGSMRGAIRVETGSIYEPELLERGLGFVREWLFSGLAG